MASLFEGGSVPMIYEKGSSSQDTWNNPWIYFIFLAIFGGFGGGGGLFGGNRATAGEQALSNDFLYSNLSNKLDTMGSTNIQGFSGINATLNTGFQGLANGICNSTYELKSSIDECCCQTQKAILESGYRNDLAIANQTSALLTNSDRNTQAILDKLCQAEIRELQTANAHLASSLSDAKTAGLIAGQTNAIQAQLCDIRNSMIHKPVYSVPFPYCAPTA